MKKLVKRAFARAGFRLSRSSKQDADRLSLYHASLTTLLSCRDRLRIVQVGANDGLLNDQLSPFVRRHAQRADILLIEPQANLIPILRDNYAFHPDPIIHNGAIGPQGTLDLHIVRPSVWPLLNVHYARGWPSYRAPTGVSSTNRKHVEDWLRKTYKGDPAEAIEAVSVPSSPLAPVLLQYGWEPMIDVLQVDTEGFDDEVIYACDIAASQPRVINYEWALLSPTSAGALSSHLARHGYEEFQHGRDKLAIRTAP